MFKLILSIAACAFALAGITTASAADLDQILQKKKIVIGVQNDLPPYSSIGDNNEPVGYDIDVAKLIAKKLGVDLEMVVLTGANRVPYLISGRVDAVVATIGITPDRVKVIDFTRPYLVFQTVMIAPKSIAVTAAKDITPYKIGVTRGTMMDPLVTKAAPSGTVIMRYDDDATTAVALATGQVDMVPTGELIAHAIADQNPAKNLEVKFVMASTYAGIGVNKENTKLRDALDGVVSTSLQDGSLQSIYKQWLKSDLPHLPENADQAVSK